MYTLIGAFDAKATLSKLLQDVQHGQRFTITIRGNPVADLVPVEEKHHHNRTDAVQAMRQIKKIHGVSGKMLSEWISEGRR
jgi:prevent-host-death family protein